MKKTIYPDYELGKDNFRIGFLTHLRKQDNKGIWRLIPVVTRGEYPGGLQEKDLLYEIKRFHCECYKVLYFYKFSEKEIISVNTPWFHFDEKDDDQRPERFRLNPHYLDLRIKVL